MTSAQGSIDSRRGVVANADAARSVIRAGLAASGGGGRRAPTASTSPVVAAAWRHRRIIVCVLCGAVAAGFLLAAWAASGDDVLQRQLETLTLAMVGAYFLGLSSLAFWSHSRQRELLRLADVERYVAAVAERLGLAGERGPERGPTQPAGSEVTWR